MIKYEKFTMEPLDGVIEEYITIFIDENNAITFRADEEDPRYQQFLLDLEQETN